MVLKRGRNSEFKLILAVWLRVSIVKLIRMAPLGWKLLKTKRLHFRSDKIQNKEELAIIINSLNGES